MDKKAAAPALGLKGSALLNNLKLALTQAKDQKSSEHSKEAVKVRKELSLIKPNDFAFEKQIKDYFEACCTRAHTKSFSKFLLRLNK